MSNLGPFTAEQRAAILEGLNAILPDSPNKPVGDQLIVDFSSPVNAEETAAQPG